MRRVIFGLVLLLLASLVEPLTLGRERKVTLCATSHKRRNHKTVRLHDIAQEMTAE